METAIQTKQALVARLRQREADLRALGVDRLGLFGSFRHDRATPESDVDVLVEFAPGEKTFRHFMDLADLLEALAGRPVELLTKESLSPHIGPHILGEVEYVAF